MTGRGVADATQLYTDLTYQTMLLGKLHSEDQAAAFGTFSAL